MEFITGCNYLASNAGTEMWRRWDENCVKQDLKRLSQNGLKYLRVFPTWDDFQPVTSELGVHSEFYTYSMRDGLRPTNIYYLDDTMLSRFERLCDFAEEYGLKLIVALITGWLSSKQYIPPVLQGKNVFTDPTALMFEQKYVKGIVERFKDRKCIYGWDLGNECNCMYKIDNADIATSWSYMITNAIRAVDTKHPVLSGMANMGPDRRYCNWALDEQGEVFDVVTTHPYIYFRPKIFTDGYTTVKPTLYATAESRYFADLSHKPCLAEEFGTLGNSLCSDKVSADFARINLWSCFANDVKGLMWWCTFDQYNLEHSPYEWAHLEDELGLFTADSKPKQTVKEFDQFAKFVNGLGFTLPEPKYDAVCIVSADREQWTNEAVSFMSYVYSKQAGVNVKFAFANEELPDSKMYIMPSLTGDMSILKSYYFKLRDKIEKGASLFMTVNNMFLVKFKEFSGVEIVDSYANSFVKKFEFSGHNYAIKTDKHCILKADTAEVLATDSENNPVFTKNQLGKGYVYTLFAPPELAFLGEHGGCEQNIDLLYKKACESVIDDKVITTDNRNIFITEHYSTDGIYAVIINHNYEDIDLKLNVKEGYKIDKIYYGEKDKIKAYDTVVLKLRK